MRSFFSRSRPDPLEVLGDARLMRSAEEGEAFERAVGQLSRRMNPRDLSVMLLAFDDQTEQPERMWGLLHLVEDFADDVYATAYLGSLTTTVAMAREWMETLLIRQLNSESARATLIRQAATAGPAIREALFGLLDGVAAMDAPVGERARTTKSQLATI